MTINTSRRLRQLAEAVLFEVDEADAGPQPGYVNYGLHDRPAVSDPAIEQPITVDPLASSESLLNLPPVDDPEYSPTSVAELKLALYALAQDVPGDRVQALFRAVRKKVDELSTGVKLSEARGGGYFGDDDEGDLDDYEKGAAVQFVPGDEEMSYDELAQKMGFKSGSAARNIEVRTMSKMKYILDNIKMQEYDILQDDAVESFALGMRDLGIIDENDVAELLSSAESVKELPSFRYYFNNAYVMPAYKELNDAAAERVSDSLDRLSITPDMKEFLLPTIMNQITGEAKVNHNAILRKLQMGNPSKTNPVDAMDPVLADEVFAEYKALYPSLASTASLDGKLVELARVLQSKKSSSKIASEIKRALSQAGEDYGAE
jgi:hypothetical protein